MSVSVCRTVYDCVTLNMPTYSDERGNLSFFEGIRHIPFEMKRCYWIYDVPGGEHRGEHAFRLGQEFVIALSGSLEIWVDDGVVQKVISLNRARYGVLVPSRIWRSFKNFSTNAVALVCSSIEYDPSDYIDDYSEYKLLNAH